MIKKLNYPSFFDVVPITVVITGGIQEDGTEKEILRKELKCNYQESTKRVQNAQGLWVPLSGIIRFKGDICPDVPNPGGYVIINNQKITISNYSRPRNPDGSVNHSRLELM